MWSLGNSWLKVSEFRDYLRQQISFYLELNEASAPSPLALWDILKAIIKGQIILYIIVGGGRKTSVGNYESWKGKLGTYRNITKKVVTSQNVHPILGKKEKANIDDEWDTVVC